MTRRLDALTDAARRLSEGELGVRAEGVGGSDELTLLADTFNDVSATVSLGHEQISALADGRLDDPVLDEPMPGPVGDTMRTALGRLGDVTAELAHEANHDRLTGLLDRRGFHRAGLELDENTAWALMIIDLDGFKVVNDTFGHAVGDGVLASVAARLAASLRADDLAARIGGDEFGAFVALDAVEQVADRMLASLREPVVVDGEPHDISASIGWTAIDDHDDIDDAFRAADLAMYDAKRNADGTRGAATPTGQIT